MILVKESEIQRQILNYLGKAGILHWRVCLGAVAGSGFRRSNPMKGHPDIAGVLKGGRYFAIEVKRPGKKVTWYPEQLEWRDRLSEAGVLYIAATSVDDVAKAFFEVRSAS